MGHLEKRIERLETADAGRKDAEESEATPQLRRYFEALENVKREQVGLEPLEIPYTREELENDLTMIEEMRDDPGWQTPEAQALLNQWERDIREKIEKGTTS